MSRFLVAAIVLAGVAGSGPVPAVAPRCTAPARLVLAPPWLAASRWALVERTALTIVALGSSTTEGVGASEPARTDHAQLAALLEERLPHVLVRVLNRGVGGEIMADDRLRLDRDMLAPTADLVIWQLGINAALREIRPARVRDKLRQGLCDDRSVRRRPPAQVGCRLPLSRRAGRGSARRGHRPRRAAAALRLMAPPRRDA